MVFGRRDRPKQPDADEFKSYYSALRVAFGGRAERFTRGHHTLTVVVHTDEELVEGQGEPYIFH